MVMITANNSPVVYSGLSATAAAERLRVDGYNEIPAAKKRPILRIFFDVIKEPMLLFLISCGAIYLLLGEAQDALMLVAAVFVVIGITFYQQHKTERALEALKELASPKAIVVREGIEVKIPNREVVINDVIVLHEGDRVPADARVLSCANLSIDESLLTGESVPVRKIPWDGSEASKRPGGDGSPFVYSGSLIVQGHGLAEVTATGIGSEMGKIGKALQTIEKEDTLLHRDTIKIVKIFLAIGLLLCLMVIILLGISRGDWLHAFLAGISLGMAMLPEEFPVILTIFLTLGAWRISKQHVLTRNLSVIDTLGATTCLCVDKTGTLTQNRMLLKKVSTDHTIVDLGQETQPVSPHVQEVLKYSLLASQKSIFDPLEIAVKEAAQRHLTAMPDGQTEGNIVKEYPLTKNLLAFTQVWQTANQGEYKVASKGAPEHMIELCHIDGEEKNRLTEEVQALTGEGLRVLGVARARMPPGRLPDNPRDIFFEFLGFISFYDPIRDTVPAAIQECYSAGIKVVMITGDYPATAQSVARQIGLQTPENYLSGQELSKLNPLELQERIKNVSVFARILPEQKLAIVTALKANGEIVAMTGDGINDAPALKAAQVGLAMGERGADVAREAADMVLMNDDFGSLVKAVRQGRRIYDNLKKAMSYVLAIHIPIAGITLIPILINKPEVMLPAMIAFLELIIDPACSTVFEAEQEDDDIMKRTPRVLTEPLFASKTVSLSMLLGLSVLFMVLLVYVWGLWLGESTEIIRSLTFTTLVVANLSLIFANRSWTKPFYRLILIKNTAWNWIFTGATITLVSMIYIPWLRSTFHFGRLDISDWVVVVGAGLGSILWFEVIKMLKLTSKR